jgi:serine/threonine-protein kinase RsbW
MTGSMKRRFEARMDHLALAVAFIEGFCKLHDIPPPDALRLTLIVEELFTNTVVHGHGGDHDSPVHIELDFESPHLALRYQDCAPPFDPLRYLRELPAESGTPVEERRVGGLGLPIVAQMAERFDYAQVDGMNSLYLVLSLRG